MAVTLVTPYPQTGANVVASERAEETLNPVIMKTDIWHETRRKNGLSRWRFRIHDRWGRTLLSRLRWVPKVVNDLKVWESQRLRGRVISPSLTILIRSPSRTAKSASNLPSSRLTRNSRTSIDPLIEATQNVLVDLTVGRNDCSSSNHATRPSWWARTRNWKSLSRRCSPLIHVSRPV